MVGKGQITSTYRLRRRCSRCLGQGYVVIQRCSECGIEAEVIQPLGEGGEPVPPCAHDRQAYVEVELVCQTCKGAGTVIHAVSEKEYEAARRRRLRRAMVLLMVALVPLVALGWAVFSADPNPLCGSWWYGVLLPVIVFRPHVVR